MRSLKPTRQARDKLIQLFFHKTRVSDFGAVTLHETLERNFFQLRELLQRDVRKVRLAINRIEAEAQSEWNLGLPIDLVVEPSLG
jgi:hypothetical protein